MPEDTLTLMAVHAHPDDECIGTGGLLARCAAEGIRTVLVTCTDGRCGDGPGGVKPGEDGHDPDEVVAVRSRELAESCRILGVDHLEQLGFRDSGMMGWATNDEPGAFWDVDVLEAARPLVDLIDRYRPQVVVTYDANGFYGHPDHIMAHRVAMAATAASGIPDRLYYTAVPRSMMAQFRRRLTEVGIEVPGTSDREEGQYAEPVDAAPGDAGVPAGGRTTGTVDPDHADGPGPTDPTEGVGSQPFGAPDVLVTTTLDVAPWVDRKRASLAAHASQGDNIFFLRLPQEVFADLFGTEHFVRAVDRSGGEVPEEDLFAGLRPKP